MITDPLRGYLLHQWAVGETSAQLIFFTREKGLIRARWKGANSIKKKAILQPFIDLWMVLNERSYGYYVQTLEISSFRGVLNHGQLMAGLYINELLYRTLLPGETDIVLFNAYDQTLRILLHAKDRLQIEMILRRFEWCWINSLGTLVAFALEADGKTPIVPHLRYCLVPESGFIAAAEGFLGEHLLAISADHWDDPVVLKTGKSVMRQLVHHALAGKTLQISQLYSAF